MTGRIGWVDATGGLSGDMLLGACLDAGADLAVVRDAIDRLDLPERVEITSEPAVRAGIGATRAIVTTAESRHRRTLPDVLALLEGQEPAVRTRAAEVFANLADAEGRVHRVPAEEVHFHEVGALDSIADVVGVVAALGSLDLDRLVCSPIALGGGRARTEHGPIPVPGPAVVELLRAHDAPGFGGPIDIELATPTGVALMVTLADGFGPLPGIRPELVGAGAGTAEPEGHANLTRLVVGSPAATAAAAVPEVVLEANVDDLDPRLWPGVLVRADGGRRVRRLADPDPDEEGPARAHAVGAGPAGSGGGAGAGGARPHHHDRAAPLCRRQGGAPPRDRGGRGLRRDRAGQARSAGRRDRHRHPGVRRRGAGGGGQGAAGTSGDGGGAKVGRRER